jgi:hypothetical protein
MLLPPLSDTRRGNGALILVVLITIAIVLYLMFGMNSGGSSGGSTSKPGGGSYMGQVAQTRKQGRETANEISTQQLSILIAQYRQEHNGKLPKSPTDFDDGGASFNDQWGHQMSFSFEENKATGKTVVKYHSNGPDGEPGTEDDVTRTDVLPF